MRRSQKMQFKIDKRKYKADCPFDYEDGFKRGVEWADKNPKYEMVNKQKFIENACEWLKQIMYVEYIFEYDEDEKPVQYVCASACDSVDEFVNNFRKIMEE